MIRRKGCCESTEFEIFRWAECVDPAVLDAVRDGTIPEDMIDNAVRKILALKAKMLK